MSERPDLGSVSCLDVRAAVAGVGFPNPVDQRWRRGHLEGMIRSCPACDASNRVPGRHLADTGRCGACKAPLSPLTEPIDVDAPEFDEITASARVPVLVDFWAAWCGPCRAVAPEVAWVAREMAGKALVLKVNTEHHPELAARFDVRGIPCFAVFSGGKLVRLEAGMVNRRQLRRWLDDAGAT